MENRKQWWDTKDSRITEILDKSGGEVDWMKAVLAIRKGKERVGIRGEQSKRQDG